jgi:spoIIIJ-associated protein
LQKDMEQIQQTAQTLLDLMGIQGELSIAEDKENEAVVVTIDTEDAGILIGRHGETISAFQLILNQIINRGSENWQRILVDCGDYRTRQEESLRNLAASTAEQVKESGEPKALYDLTPAQRRIVHMVLSEDPDIITESEGEGRERHLVVRPK